MIIMMAVVLALMFRPVRFLVLLGLVIWWCA